MIWRHAESNTILALHQVADPDAEVLGNLRNAMHILERSQ